MSRSSDVDPQLAARLHGVQERVADAARAAGRDPAQLTTIVVTKFHPASLVRDLAALGVRDVGENRAQEARVKASETADLSLRWHFIGQLQTNKAKLVRGFASAVHSIDRPALADALGSDDGDLDCFVQLNLTDDPSRGGAARADLQSIAERVLGTRGLRLRGVMAVAPLGEEPRRAFSRVREASDALRTVAPEADAISAGMSGDFEEAIAEGATHLRLGTAITGKRPDHA
ncbi:YggS family pyridoxal phosphate-dependent enzyme [Humibacter sp. RRB41]|uniref:YggS family pyridoxal phosphate-dependent enzyme n=1 Tax=Humibacter sp. RRB41 TaxID=2919946 RepID=UPI001FAB07AA|nr:YggS family pyridoxal phosphate-dependent enzyme [Humibacter sp. RRB41]